MKSARSQWQRTAALAAAGAAAFAVGTLLSPSGRDGDSAERDVVAPVIRAATSPRSVTPSVPSQELALNAELDTQASTRLSEHVIYNPFASLSLNAASGPMPVAASGVGGPSVQPKKKRKKEEPPAAPAPAPAQVAPSLPFAALGSIAGDEVTQGKRIAFINQQGQLLVVRAGDSIGPLYRVESITAQKIEFMYLPFMQRQALALAP